MLVFYWIDAFVIMHLQKCSARQNKTRCALEAQNLRCRLDLEIMAESGFNNRKEHKFLFKRKLREIR